MRWCANPALIGVCSRRTTRRLPSPSTMAQRSPLAWSARSSSKTLDLMRRRLGSYSDVEDQMETVRVIYHHETDGWWAESPDVEGWSAAGNSYQEVAKLAEEGIRFALERDDVALENFVPVGDSVAA